MALKKDKLMTPTTKTDEGVKITRLAFDLDSMKRVKLEGTFVPPTPVKSLEELSGRVNNDIDRLMSLVNKALINDAKREAKQSLIAKKADGTINLDVIPSSKMFLPMLEGMRLQPEFQKFPDTKKGKKLQTEALLQAVRKNDALMAGIKMIVAALPQDDEIEEDEDDETTE